MSLTIKIADSPEELAQISKLNYSTFVEEIPQHVHSVNEEKILLDKFHEQNTYIIARDQDKVVGMISINGKRPFSLDGKLEKLDSYLPEHKGLCEIRLLAVKKNYRGGKVFYNLMLSLKEYAVKNGYDLAVISGTIRQIRLYKSIGFVEFGPLTGSGDALFQPMYLTRSAMESFLKRF